MSDRGVSCAAEPEPEPETPGVAGLALALGKQVAGKLFGAGLDKLLAPVLGWLGLGGGGQDFQGYYNGIMSEFQKVEGGLAQIEQQLREVATAVQQVAQGLLDIEAQLTDAELQAALRAYITAAAVVQQNFQSYTAALGGLADPTLRPSALRQLYDLFAITNADTVAIALRQIHTAVLGGPELPGILSFQGEVVRRAVDAATVATDRQVVNDAPLATWRGGGWIDSDRIVTTAIPVSGAAIEAQVVPVFRAILTVQLQGLLFLATAWARTDLDPTLTLHVDHLHDEIAAMQAFYPQLDLDGLIAGVLRQRGVPLSATHPEVVSAPWASGGQLLAYPFSEEWLMWHTDLEPSPAAAQWLKVAEIASHLDEATLLQGLPPEMRQLLLAQDDTRALVQAPWNYGVCQRAFRLANHASMEEQRPDGSFVSVDFTFNGYDTVEVPRPSAAKVPPPALAALLDGLPTT